MKSRGLAENEESRANQASPLPACFFSTVHNFITQPASLNSLPNSKVSQLSNKHTQKKSVEAEACKLARILATREPKICLRQVAKCFCLSLWEKALTERCEPAAAASICSSNNLEDKVTMVPASGKNQG